jgi:DNA adenine methylase
MFQPGYIGGKAAAGVFHRIIGEMPPHSVYLEPFFGSGAVFWNKRPAQSSILIDRSPEVIARIGDAAGVNAIVGDAISIVPTLALPAGTVAYFDPPYPLGTRNGRSYYKHELSDEDHERLIAMILKLPFRVLISSYPNALYAHALRDWRCCRFSGVTRGGRKRK